MLSEKIHRDIERALVSNARNLPIFLRNRAERALRGRLKHGKGLGDLSPEADVASLASFLMTVIYGNVLRAKEGQSRASLQETIEIALYDHSRAHGSAV